MQEGSIFLRDFGKAGAGGSSASFLSARPVWPEGREKEMNLFVGFRAAFEAPAESPVILRVTASTVYRAWVNGAFCGYGPARGPRGWFRVDEWDLSRRLRPGRNLVAIEVSAYNCNTYYYPDQIAFLQAEVVAGNAVLTSTAGEGEPFAARLLADRVQKTQRYSFQRGFTEFYRLQHNSDRWRREIEAGFEGIPCAILPDRKHLPRRAPCPTFELRQPAWQTARGELRTGVQPASIRRGRHLENIGPQFRGFHEDELDVLPAIELQRTETTSREIIDRPFPWGASVALGAGSWRILDFGVNLTGFPGAEISCRERTRLFMTFDEILTDGDVDFLRMNCANVVGWKLAPGSYRVECMEPYTFRYLKIIALDGACEVRNPYLREYANPDVWTAQFRSSDERLDRIFEAGRETLRQNALDVFMDCPSRERAGWLCDSFFTARAAFALSGNARVEQAFFENFLMPGSFAGMPEGMLPMCYPADHDDGNFIPNWALWFVLQLEEYLARSGDRAMGEALSPKVHALFDYFRRFRNDDGLLEKLDKWVFVEWSKANSFVQDVNYPTNMLYAAALDAAGRIYDEENLLDEAGRIRETVRRQSFDGTFFIDNAIREDGRLRPTHNRTETCQYYAFYFDVAAPESHADLWRMLIQEFGPRRDPAQTHPDVHKANAFIGNMLRLELLSRHGRVAQVLAESVDYWHYMAERTGTLWEHVDERASCNHGFASHICHLLYRDVAGLCRLDPLTGRVLLRFADLPLESCEARVPTPEGFITLAWRREGRQLTWRANAPAGYAVEVENSAGLDLVREP